MTKAEEELRERARYWYEKCQEAQKELETFKKTHNSYDHEIKGNLGLAEDLIMRARFEVEEIFKKRYGVEYEDDAFHHEHRDTAEHKAWSDIESAWMGIVGLKHALDEVDSACAGCPDAFNGNCEFAWDSYNNGVLVYCLGVK